jgi:hypothetical protein
MFLIQFRKNTPTVDKEIEKTLCACRTREYFAHIPTITLPMIVIF